MKTYRTSSESKRAVNSFSLFTFIFLLLCVGCNTNEPAATIGNDEPLRFEIGIAPMSRATTGADFKTVWEEGDQIGVYVVRMDKIYPYASDDIVHNRPLTYNAATGTWECDDIILPKDDPTLKFYVYAYYPYDAALYPGNNYKFDVIADQRTASEFSRADLMAAEPIANVNCYARSVQLVFHHHLVMFQLTVDPSYAVFGNIEATLRGSLNQSRIYEFWKFPSPQNIINLDKTNIAMFRVEQPSDANYATSYTFRAIAPAQTFAAGSQLFHVKAGERHFFSPALTAHTEFFRSTAYTFTIDQL